MCPGCCVPEGAPVYSEMGQVKESLAGERLSPVMAMMWALSEKFRPAQPRQ